MDWTRPGRVDAFRFVRVAWPSFEEVGQVRATSCKYTENRLADLYVSGQATLAGGVDLGDDMLRAYSVSTLGGETVELCHFTMLASSDRTEFGAAVGSAQATLYGTLKVLQDEPLDETLTVPGGTDPVAYAASMCETRLLPVSAQAYGRGLAGALVFDAGTTCLAAVNGLLSAAGYGSARTDAYGRVLMSPYRDPSGKAPAFAVSESGGGLLCSPQVTRTRASSSVCNVVTLTGTDADGAPLRAQARNDAAASRWSTASRRRVVGRYEQVADVTTQAALQAKADRMLREETMLVETVELEHFWGAFSVGDSIALDVPSYGLDGSFSSTSRTVDLGPGMRCTTSVRRFVEAV